MESPRYKEDHISQIPALQVLFTGKRLNLDLED